MKSRHISIITFFDVLQKEYVQAEFRRKIHIKLSDKAYYQRVMDHKKAKIEDLAERNSLHSIFTSIDVRKAYHRDFYGGASIGFDGQVLTDDEKFYYFHPGSDVNIQNELGVVLSSGVILNYNAIKGVVEVDPRNLSGVRYYSERFVKRIL